MNLAAELALLPPSDALKIALRILGERDQNIAKYEQIILDNKQIIAHKEQIILDNHQFIANKDQTIANKDQEITDKDFHYWLVNTRKTGAPNSGTAKALGYSIKRWAALERYSTAGHYPIDNNPVENAIRPIAIGKKNWLFAGSERAGFRAAAIQSLFATAKLNGVDPAQWLAETLEKLPTHPHSRIDELLPIKA